MYFPLRKQVSLSQKREDTGTDSLSLKLASGSHSIESPFLGLKLAFLPRWEENDKDKDSLSWTGDRWIVKNTLNDINAPSTYLILPENVVKHVPSWVFFLLSGLLKSRAILTEIHTFIRIILWVLYLNSLFRWMSGYFLHAGLLRKTGLTRND